MDRHKHPTTIGQEFRVDDVHGELLGFVGETSESPESGKPWYARPTHERTVAAGLAWFDNEADARKHLLAAASS